MRHDTSGLVETLRRWGGVGLGSLALFTSLGGTSWAAEQAKQITGQQIAAKTIKGVDIADGTITAKQIAKNSITGALIKDGSVDLDDLDGDVAESLQGQQGPPGAPGSQGPQGPQGQQGPQGAQGPAGNVAGTAGGSLTGTYPDPAIANGVIGDAQIKSAGLSALLSIKPGSIFSSNLSDGAVTEAKLAGKAVGTEELADGAVTPAKIPAASIDSSKLAADPYHRPVYNSYSCPDDTSKTCRWRDFGRTNRYYKDGYGRVYFDGGLVEFFDASGYNNGVDAARATIFTLPAGYRPDVTTTFFEDDDCIEITPAGAVRVCQDYGNKKGEVIFQHISFRATQ